MGHDYDLIIVGGGIGGSALATVMAGAGYRVLLLEKSPVFEDQVRGEWISPWGVVETKRLGLYDALVAAGGHHVRRHITYDETRPSAEAEAAALPLDIFAEGVSGPLCIRHPIHCQTLFDAAARAGCDALRGVVVGSIENGARPSVTFAVGGEERTASARLVIGADGRTSQVRRAADIRLHMDKPHHWFGGLLVADVQGWDEHTQAIGTEGELGFLAFPQGNGKVRLYAGYPLSAGKRFAGSDGVARFLQAFDMACSPNGRYLAKGRPAGPLRSYYNMDSWTERPGHDQVLLIGDAAGWNDPINGLGLSITYRDVRIVSEALKSTADWSPGLFDGYADERRERMRRLRFVARISARLDMEFDADARRRRQRYLTQLSGNPDWGRHMLAIMAGPELVDAGAFTVEHARDMLGEDADLDGITT